MAGHNKWSKVKHKKAAEDAKKSKVFSVLARTIAMEARRAGGNTSDPGLKAAIDRARAQNMPNDNIERAIARGTGAGADEYSRVLYEAYGPGGAALLIEGVTDNKNRTSAGIKHVLSKQGASLGAPGSAVWAFQKTASGAWEAETVVPLEEEIRAQLKKLIEALRSHDDVEEVYTNAAL